MSADVEFICVVYRYRIYVNIDKYIQPEQRKELQAQARKEARRKSRQFIKSQVGAKEHFSDDDVELQEDKPHRSGLKARKKVYNIYYICCLDIYILNWMFFFLLR